MLRLVLLVLYLIASSSAFRQTEQSAGLDYGAGYDPDGVSSSPSTGPTSDAGAGYDPNG
jgi:hypothetical protein